jgi:hypothetical protein
LARGRKPPRAKQTKVSCFFFTKKKKSYFEDFGAGTGFGLLNGETASTAGFLVAFGFFASRLPRN